MCYLATCVFSVCLGVQHLERWVQSQDQLERERAMQGVLVLLQAYCSFSEGDEACRHLPLQGQILGRMVPRCSDPSRSIRQMAIDCIQLTLKIATCTPGEGRG